MVVDGMRSPEAGDTCEYRPEDWRLDLRLDRPGVESVHWAHTPATDDYSVVAGLRSVAMSTAVGINLARGESNAGVSFMVDPGTQEWWVEGQTAAGGPWTELTPRRTDAALGQGTARELEVRVYDGRPSFFVNGAELAAGVDTSWLTIPRTGNAGIVVATSPATALQPPSADFESFGIYALKTDAGPDEAEGTLASLLPTQDEVPGGMVLTEEGGRLAGEITGTFPDAVAAARRFDEWGWQKNAYREFAAADGSASVSVSLHRFADDNAASEALPYLVEARHLVSGSAFERIDIVDLGEQVEALGGAVPGGREASLFVRRGDTVARISVIMPAGDPSLLAHEVASAVVEGMQQGEPDPPGPDHRG